ncbi:MAG TPA: FtsQ-type POTRA domain-containing protein [Streptosporangiaceae bacterium]|nr:FtsQ-type POTRA domain-containing protein [Streptosporangiaceae bacterium]
MIDATAATAARGRAGRWKAIFVAALVLGVLGTSAWVLFGSRVLVVRNVEVTGTRLVPKSQVVAATGVPLGGSMIKLDTGTVAERVAGIQQVESVRVERRWPTTLRIEVRERVPTVVAVQGGRYYHIDRFGVIVLATSARPRGLPELRVAAPDPRDPATAAALAVWRSLPGRFRGRVATIGATDPEDVTLRLRSGVSVMWGAAERAAEKLKLVEALAGTAAGRSAHTIDVSSPEVVTTR